MKNKISILSLHMKNGGIERSIVNQANMLSNYYDVDIICLYKFSDEIPYNLDDKVNLIYLSNLKPNKEEFINEVKNKNIIGILKEGFKSIKILFLKKYLIYKYILNTDSKVIISTRIEFTKILNKIKKPVIKIAEEHVYHNNDMKYINELRNNLNNIDYLIPASKYITKDYKGMFDNIKIKYIPQTVDDTDNYNKKYNKNIIAVGRLEEVKGFIDLIDIFKLVNENDKSIKLTIVGDGSQKKYIESKIKEYKLEKDIILTGSLNSDELNKLYKKSSILVMTSYEESFGLVLLEAMSYKLPCIAFDSALGACELINSKCGYLISNRDKDLMATKIVSLLNNRKLIEKMGNESYDFSKNYMISKVEKDWFNFIKSIL